MTVHFVNSAKTTRARSLLRNEWGGGGEGVGGGGVGGGFGFFFGFFGLMSLLHASMFRRWGAV